MYYISLTPRTKYRAKTGNNLSKFVHSTWLTMSYYLSPKHESLIPRSLIHSFHFCALEFWAWVGNIYREC